jgi:hypothetical protein
LRRAETAPDNTVEKPANQPKPTNKPGCITEKQRKRMFAIAKANGWSETKIRDVLSVKGYEHTSDVPMGQVYDEICALFSQNAAEVQL